VRLTHLHLSRFRNYDSLEWAPAPGLTVLFGANAQGKSNLLEAVAFLSLARSPRAASDRETIAWSALTETEPVARLVGRIEKRGGPLEIEIAVRALQEGQPAAAESVVQKRIRVNGVALRASELVGQLAVAIFSPEDIELVIGSPSQRRRFLDMTISQVDRRYLRALQRYQRVVLQRNHLLRRLSEGAARPEELEYWDHELAQNGATLIVRRRASVAQLAAEATVAHARLSGGGEAFTLVYREAWGPNGTAPPAGADEIEVARALGVALALGLPRDTKAGATLLGPHRDDLLFFLNDRALASFGSRGQQRSAVLALRLAEARYLEASTGEAPVILLDDALSELDLARRCFVMELAASREQALVTVSEPGMVPAAFRERATLLEVHRGSLSPA